jgi:hypothetical protein
MKRIILVLAMLALVTVTALPAMAQGGDRYDGGWWGNDNNGGYHDDDNDRGYHDDDNGWGDWSSWWGIDWSTCDWYWSFSGPQYWCWSYFEGWVQPW